MENYIPVAINTILIKPVWMLINRHFCALQPFDRLRRGRQPASKSTALEYSAHPSQFALLRAIKNGDWLLSVVCSVVFLTSLLSIALGGLFFDNTGLRNSPVPLRFSYARDFVTLNGSNPQSLQGSPLDSYYIATSNITEATPLPPWTDDDYFWMPFTPAVGVSVGQNGTVRGQTIGIGAMLECNTTAAPNVLSVTDGDITGPHFMINKMSLLMDAPEGLVVRCIVRLQILANSVGVLDGGRFRSSFNGTIAYEINAALDGNVTDYPINSAETQFCRSHVMAAWIRAEVSHVFHAPNADTEYANSTVNSWNATLLFCRPRLDVVTADITVTQEGRLQTRGSTSQWDQDPASLFTNSSTVLDLWDQVQPSLVDRGGVWHRDDYPSDFTNYLIAQTWDADLINPTLPIPAPGLAAARYATMYRKLFAIYLSHNKDSLFVPDLSAANVPGSQNVFQGILTVPITKVFMSRSFFIITEIILILYIITTAAVFLQRPWRVLARLPDSPASIIAYFAGSRAVHDMHNGDMEKSPLIPQTGNVDEDPTKSGVRISVNPQPSDPILYGFGGYRAQDGSLCIGIEKEPFVKPIVRIPSNSPLDSEKVGHSASAWNAIVGPGRGRKRTFTLLE